MSADTDNERFETTGRSRKGEPLVWLTAAGLAIGVTMAIGLFLLILVKGAASFWPKRIELFEVKRGETTEMIAGYVTQTQERKDAEGKLVEELQIFRGNKDVSGEAFIYVDVRDIVNRSVPEKFLLFERLTYGPAIGEAVAIETKDGRTEADGWKLETLIHKSEETRAKALHIERKQIGKISAEIEEIGFDLKAKRISEGDAAARKAELEKDFTKLKAEADKLNDGMAGTNVIYKVADGRERSLPSGQLLSVYTPNTTGFFGRLGEALRRAWHFLKEDPREANTEGGVFPAIFGTVVMTLVMSLFVTPFGVIAAIYLREYAKQGLMVRIVRICVNNLAGVPSIVFGVFGLAFFVYFVGAGIDQTFYSEKLPTPTFGTPGILWASLTLALLTLPVVIVATEEALSAVPRGVREAALACGASKWQTIQRVVLPASLPGILTGVILAMARGAGEVAPLMLVGVVKLAPSLPIDGIAPFIHAERKFMHLGFHIYDLGFQSPDAEAAKPFVYATALLLILVVVSLNLTAIIIRNRLKKRFAVSSF
ncbi:MAG: phosphate transporter permease PstA [Verrucomicrobiota bacterium]|jgi:phosphate transport system permease protein